MTVRFITRRFIGEYDPLLEKVYCCTKMIDSESVLFEVLDTAAQEEHSRIEENIKWADAFVLLYSVTDRCSLNECCRLKFLINSYNKRHRKANLSLPDVAPAYSPVVLVGNQIDRCYDRMVTAEEGQEKARELGCVGFYEISVRECVECVQRIFADLYYCYRRPKKQRAAYKAASLAMMRAASLSMDDSLDMIGSRQEVPHSKRRGALHTIS